MINSKTGFFGFGIPSNQPSSYPQKKHAKANYSMVDLFGFPHVSRVYYTKSTPIEKKLYNKLIPKCPAVHRWIVRMLALPELNDGKAIIPEKGFKLWIDELMMMPTGTKPPLRLPVKL